MVPVPGSVKWVSRHLESSAEFMCSLELQLHETSGRNWMKEGERLGWGVAEVGSIKSFLLTTKEQRPWAW